MTLCGDSVAPNPDEYLPALTGEPVRFEIPGDVPKAVRVSLWKTLPRDADITQTPHGEPLLEQMLVPVPGVLVLPLDVSEGRIVVELAAAWPQRSAAWLFSLEVRAPVAGAGPNRAAGA